MGNELAWTAVTERGKNHTLEEWLAQPGERRVELIGGEFVEKPAPDFSHALSQSSVIRSLTSLSSPRRGGSGPPTGWWIVSELDIVLGTDGFRPDLAGWRRERLPAPPRTEPIDVTPDWVCEVLSNGNRTNDTIRKLRRYHQAGVGHSWLLDPAAGTLTVMRHAPQGYATILTADRGQSVRAEPFAELELRVGDLFGDDAP